MSGTELDLDLLEPREAAKALGVSELTLIKWRGKREYASPRPTLRFVRVGNRIRYRAADIRKYLELTASDAPEPEPEPTPRRRRRKAA